MAGSESGETRLKPQLGFQRTLCVPITVTSGTLSLSSIIPNRTTFNSRRTRTDLVHKHWTRVNREIPSLFRPNVPPSN